VPALAAMLEFNCVSKVSSFHSINVPSEWGQMDSRRGQLFIVSIQLMSPASGDTVVTKYGEATGIPEFPFN
jgi:hypothetical protein